jgi:hypothetical protein
MRKRKRKTKQKRAPNKDHSQKSYFSRHIHTVDTAVIHIGSQPRYIIQSAYIIIITSIIYGIYIYIIYHISYIAYNTYITHCLLSAFPTPLCLLITSPYRQKPPQIIPHRLAYCLCLFAVCGLCTESLLLGLRFWVHVGAGTWAEMGRGAGVGLVGTEAGVPVLLVFGNSEDSNASCKSAF